MLLPAWLAAIVQVPAARPVTVLPLTEQTPRVVELKLTGSPEVAAALAVEAPPTPREAGLKLMVPMVWLALVELTIVVIVSDRVPEPVVAWTSIVYSPAERLEASQSPCQSLGLLATLAMGYQSPPFTRNRT